MALGYQARKHTRPKGRRHGQAISREERRSSCALRFNLYCSPAITSLCIAQEISDHDVTSSDQYTLHRILHGVPEGHIDIPAMHAFPMDSNLDVMGGCEPLHFIHRQPLLMCISSRVQERLLCRPGADSTNIPHRRYSQTNSSCGHTQTRSDVRIAISHFLLALTVFCRPTESVTSSLDAPSFPTNVDIRPSVIRAFDDSRPAPRPRGTGKLLSSQQGVGLALLRLEHVEAAEKGVLRFEFNASAEEGQDTWALSHWWPDWWPRQPEE